MIYDAEEIKRMLANQAERFCNTFLSNGHKDGAYWRAADIYNSVPRGNGSFIVNLSGDKPGLGFENGNDSASKKSGTLIDILIVQKNLGYRKALEEAQRWLGISIPASVQKKPASSQGFISKKHLTPVQDASPAFLYLSSRGLDLQTMRRYHVCDCKRWFSALKRETDAIAFPIYSQDGESLLNIKYLSLHRENGKKFCTQETNGTNHLFGLSAVPDDARELVICEGEIDAMTVAMAGFAAVSVPMGAHADSETGKLNKANEWIENDWEFLARFDKIRLCMDNDEVGKAAASSLFARLGMARTEIVEIPKGAKDPNEYAALEGLDALAEVIRNSKSCDPDMLARARKFEKKLYSRLTRQKGDYPGYDLPWPFGEHFRIRMGETSIVSGYPGHGKTTALDNILVYFAAEYGLKSCIASLEVPTDQTEETLWRIACGRRSLLDEKDNEILGLFEKSMDFLNENFFFFDSMGVAKVDDVLTVFEYCARKYGAKIFCLDSLMCLDVGEEDYEKQKNIMSKICAFAFKFSVHVFIVCHPKKMSEKKNAETYVPFREDVSGSGHLGNLAHNVIVFWRAIGKAGEIFKAQQGNNYDAVKSAREKPDGAIYIRKQREGTGELPIKNLWFDEQSRQFYSRYGQQTYKAVTVSYTPSDENFF